MRGVMIIITLLVLTFILQSTHVLRLLTVTCELETNNKYKFSSRKFLVKQKAEMFYFITLGSSAVFSDCNCQKN